MTRDAWPNLGAEEGVDDDVRTRSLPAGAAAPLHAAAALFCALVEIDDAERARVFAVPRARLPAIGLVPWLSTTRAVDVARARGVAYAGPPPALVRAVHDKAFALQEGAAFAPSVLAGIAFTVEALAFAPEHKSDVAASIEQRVAAWPVWARERFTLKPRLGTSGRGRVAGRDGRIDARARDRLSRFAERGGAVVEPWLDRVVDLSAQWWVDESGDAILLGTTTQRVRQSGVYLGCDVRFVDGARPRAVDVDETAEHRLVEASARVVAAAAAQGFTGPCGVDAFTFREPGSAADAAPLLRPVVELNARATIGTLALFALGGERDPRAARSDPVRSFRL